MSVRSVALTMAIFGAGTMFLLAWWLILFERIYIGYSYTPLGSVIGAAYGFVDFGIAGAIFAWLYNWINKKS